VLHLWLHARDAERQSPAQFAVRAGHYGPNQRVLLRASAAGIDVPDELLLFLLPLERLAAETEAAVLPPPPRPAGRPPLIARTKSDEHAAGGEYDGWAKGDGEGEKGEDDALLGAEGLRELAASHSGKAAALPWWSATAMTFFIGFLGCAVCVSYAGAMHR
jgi:hypothetical protein